MRHPSPTLVPSHRWNLRNCLLALGAFFYACVSSGQALEFEAIHAVGDHFSGVAHVTDGDTIRVDNVRVRIQGIDAPEKAQTCERTDSASYACGSEATAYLRLMAEGRVVSCVAQAIDKYQRTVASCAVDGKDLGSEMVLSGHAVAFRRYTSIYDAQEMQARNARRGLWNGTFTDPSDYRRLKRNGGF
jgi:endonuclease YncB( thermonuclease family)